jgi:hypothetical protein
VFGSSVFVLIYEFMFYVSAVKEFEDLCFDFGLELDEVVSCL